MKKKISHKTLVRAMQSDCERMHSKEPDVKRLYNIETIVLLGFALLCVAILHLNVFQITRVQGVSMEPTFVTGERLYVDKLIYNAVEPQRGDIVIAQYKGIEGHDVPVIKRIIAIEGDRIAIENGRIILNGEILNESQYWNDLIYEDMPEELISQDCVFLMGDNRNRSLDSRSQAIGEIKKEWIIGKGCFIVYPFNKFGTLPN